VVEVRDIAPGLWLWRQPHPDWEPGGDWDPMVSSFAAGTTLFDPLAPPPAEREVWDRLASTPPEVAVVLKPDHVRDIDLFVRWYGVRAFGPVLFWPGDVPRTRLEFAQPGDELPGGLQVLHDGRGKAETPVYVPGHRALVFADALTAPEGELLVWTTPWHVERTLPALRAMLELPFEHVLVSHGEPVHTRADFEAALERAPYGAPTPA
jgi:hypothetical protein